MVLRSGDIATSGKFRTPRGGFQLVADQRDSTESPGRALPSIAHFPCGDVWRGQIRADVVTRRRAYIPRLPEPRLDARNGRRRPYGQARVALQAARIHLPV